MNTAARTYATSTNTIWVTGKYIVHVPEEPKYVPTIEHLIEQTRINYHRIHGYTRSGFSSGNDYRNDRKYEGLDYHGMSLSMMSVFELKALGKFLKEHPKDYWRGNKRHYTDWLALIDNIEDHCFSIWSRTQEALDRLVSFLETINTRKRVILLPYVPKRIPSLLKNRNYFILPGRCKNGDLSVCVSHDFEDDDLILLKIAL